MLQAVATVALTLMLVAEAEEPAKRDVYRFVPITRKPTKRSKYQGMARSDGYTARPTPPYAKMFGVRGDGTKRPTTQRYPEAKGDGFMKYFRKYFTTRRPTVRRYNAASDSYRQPTQRPRYNAASDSYRRPTQRPTPRRYGVAADLKTDRPTKPYVYVAANDKKVDESHATQEIVPEPEVLDKKYFYVKSHLGWNDAQEACARRGAQLATIHSIDEHERVSKACQGECWLGAERGDVMESFKWADDSAMNFKKWGNNEPRHEEKSGLCTKMGESDKKWTSADCDKKLGFVCQKMQFKARIEANVDENDYFALARSFARGGLLSLALMITVAVVVAFLMCNYVCVLVNEKKQVDDMDAASDETKPLLWTRA